MASYQIIAWKDVPAMVEARDGAETVTRQLSDRFQQLIDSVAMRLGLQDQDAYLDLWARGRRAGAVGERDGGRRRGRRRARGTLPRVHRARVHAP